MAGADDERGPGNPARYQALYRQYRPQRFDQVLGQEHVTRALRAAVRDGRVAHAYLFSGPRGTGKTSTARILAMALNCENPSDGEPDGTCASCVAIRQGASMDVQELDAASNRRIDDVRDLLGRVALGTPGRWKLYIIDEVHQLTNDASTALLKTLEEPPGHVIFVLATTDPQKVLETIRSRTQHYEFRLLGAEVLEGLLTDVARRADLHISPDAIATVVRRGRGSARDALSALDQVAAAGTEIDDGRGAPPLVDALIAHDPGAALVEVAAAARAGLDPRRLGNDLVEYLRNLFLAPRAPDLVMLAPDELAEAKEKASAFGAAAVVRCMEVLGQALIDMRDSADPRVTLEVALVRLAAPEVDDSRPALLERVERLEKAVAALAPAALPAGGSQATGSQATGSQATGSRSATPPTPPPVPNRVEAAPGTTRSALGAHRAPDMPAGGQAPRRAPEAVTGQDAPADLPSREDLTLAWGDHILPTLRPAVKVYLATGRFVSVDERGAVYAVPDKTLLARARPGVPEVEQALASHFGRPVPFALVLDDAAPPAPSRADDPPGPAEEDPADYVLEDMEDAVGEVLSPERRLMEAFPGAEEVTG